MDDLIKKIVEKVGITAEQAKGSVAVVTGFLKEKLPDPIADQIEKIIKGIDQDGDGLEISDVTKKISGIFKK